MPSGAKKRKAAKKKKEKQFTTNPSSPSTHSQGDEDVKFKDGGEEHIEVEESAVREREFDKKNGGSSRSSNSSSSSSDDESHGVKNSQTVVEVASVVDSLKTADSLPGSTAEAVKDDSIREDIPVADAVESPLLVEKVEECTSSPADNSVVPLVESVLEENDEKRPSSDVDKVGPSVSLVDTPSEREEEVIVHSVEKVDIVLDPKESVTQENDDKLTVSFNAPTASTDDQAESEKGSEVTKPLLPPHPVQRTSWKSCCGLFEAFSGSST